MGLSRRACRPTKVILPFDTSIMETGSDYVAYLESIYTDEGHLSLDPADPPTRFHLRQWTDAHKDAIGAQDTERAVWKMGVRCSLISMSNYSIVQDGIEKPAPVLELKSEGRLGEIVPLSFMSDINFPDLHLEHLYIAARHISEAAVPLSRQSEREFGQEKSESQGNTD